MGIDSLTFPYSKSWVHNIKAYHFPRYSTEFSFQTCLRLEATYSDQVDLMSLVCLFKTKSCWVKTLANVHRSHHDQMSFDVLRNKNDLCIKHKYQIPDKWSPAWHCCSYSKWLWGPRSCHRKCLTVWLVKGDWCPQPSQLLRRDEGKQVMQIGLEAACWHLTLGMVIKNTLWQRQHLVGHWKRQPNTGVVLHYPGRGCTEDERCAAKHPTPF